jgi:type IV secretory pathway VirB4 component
MAQEAQSTQQFVDVEEIKNGSVILKNGSLRKILLVSGINFALKSEDDKNIILRAYQDFINSLDFSLQIIIHSRRLNIKGYLDGLAQRKENEQNELLREQITEYSEFIKSFVEQSDIMGKSFFVIIPYDPVIISSKGGIMSGLPFFGGKKDTSVEDRKTLNEKIEQLNQRADHVESGLSGIGLRAVALNDSELVELFYNLYNPAATEKKGMGIVGEKK